MVENIEYHLYYVTYKTIKNWDATRRTFHDAAATLRSHEISKMTDQNKRAINDEINILILGKGSNKRRVTVDAKVLCALKLGVQEDEKRSEDHVSFKVRKMLTTDAQADLRRGDGVNIGLVKDHEVKTGKPGGGRCTHITRRVKLSSYVSLIRNI